MKRCFRFLFLLATTALAAAAASEPFAIRGYYTTFMRMPTFGLAEWKQMLDCAPMKCSACAARATASPRNHLPLFHE